MLRYDLDRTVPSLRLFSSIGAVRLFGWDVRRIKQELLHITPRGNGKHPLHAKARDYAYIKIMG